MKKYLIAAIVLFFIYLNSFGQHKYIFTNEYDSLGNINPTSWNNHDNWDLFPGNTINTEDTVIVKGNIDIDIEIEINNGAVLIFDTSSFANITSSGNIVCNGKIIIESEAYLISDFNSEKISGNPLLINNGLLYVSISNFWGYLKNNSTAYMGGINFLNYGVIDNFYELSIIGYNYLNYGLINNYQIFNGGNYSSEVGVLNDQIVMPGKLKNYGYCQFNELYVGYDFMEITNDTFVVNSGTINSTICNFSTAKIKNSGTINAGTMYVNDYYYIDTFLLEGNYNINSQLSIPYNYYPSYPPGLESILRLTVINKGNLQINGEFLNYQTFINDTSGKITGSSTMFNNYSTIINYYKFLNFGRVSDSLSNSSMGIINYGDLINETSAEMYYQYLFHTDGQVINNGFFHGSIENVGNGKIQNNGIIQIKPGEHYWDYSDVSYSYSDTNSPKLLNNGTFINRGDFVPIHVKNNGFFFNYGTIDFSWIGYFTSLPLKFINYNFFENQGYIIGQGIFLDSSSNNNHIGYISPGAPPIIIDSVNRIQSQPFYGCMNFSKINGNTTFFVEAGGFIPCENHDFVTIDSAFNIEGNLIFVPNFNPAAGDIITIIHADTVINVFDTVNIPDGWEVLYNQPNKGDVSVRYGNPCNNLNSDFLQDSVRVCGSTYSLSVPNTFESYLWSNGSQDSIVSVNASGWFICSVGLGNCILRDSIFVRLVNANINQNDTSLCRGASLTLNTNSSNNILWSNNTTGTTTNVTPSLTTTYYATATDGVFTCRDSIKVNINTTLPSTPGVVSGAIDVCPLLGNNTISSVVNYTIRKIANANSYLWTLPSGVTLVSGQGDTAVNVTFSNSFVSGVISVKSVNACGVSTGTRTIAVYKRVASIPGTMYQSFSPVAAAVTSVCGRTSETYKVRKVAYTTSYSWSLSNGSFATISHTNAAGINDTAISVNFQTGFTKDTLMVKSITACSVSASRTIVLTALAVPAAVSSIVSQTGNITPCIGDEVNYTVSSLVPTASQTSAAVYRWSKPNNTTITDANTDSSVITLRFNIGFTGGSIVAKGQSACGVYGSSKILVLQYLPPTPTAIISGTGNYNACIGNAITYSVMVPTPSATQRAAVVFRWTKPAYTTIVSANTDSSVISLQFNTGYRGGTLSVKGQTLCGALGTAKAQALTNISCPAITSPTLYTKSEITNDIDFDASVYPNPSQGDFNLKIIGNGLENYEIKISDVEGRLIKQISTAQKITKWGENLQPGLYMIEVKSGLRRKVIRAVKI